MESLTDSRSTTEAEAGAADPSNVPENDVRRMQPEDFKVYMEESLPHQAVLYLVACGFDSEASFASFDTSGNEEDSFKLIEYLLRTDSQILKESSPDPRTMYGMYYSYPQSFKILPGHKSAIKKFLLDIHKENKDSENILEHYTLHTQFQEIAKCGLSVKTTTENVYANQNHKGNSTVPKMCHIPVYINDLSKTIQVFLSKSREFKELHLEIGNHYLLQVSPSTSSKREVDGFVTCVACGTKLNLPFLHSKFQPTNFYRHLKLCILKKNRPVVQKKNKPTTLSSVFINSPTIRQTRRNVATYRGRHETESDDDNQDFEENLTESTTEKRARDHSYNTNIVDYTGSISSTPNDFFASDISKGGSRNFARRGRPLQNRGSRTLHP